SSGPKSRGPKSRLAPPVAAAAAIKPPPSGPSHVAARNAFAPSYGGPAHDRGRRTSGTEIALLPRLARRQAGQAVRAHPLRAGRARPAGGDGAGVLPVWPGED